MSGKGRPTRDRTRAGRIERRAPRALAALFVVLLPAGCGDSPTGPGSAVLDLSAPWAESGPGAQGMDSVRLAVAVGQASAIPRLMSLLVVRNGTLVVEEYFRGNHADSLNDVRSVTKSVVSTLTGIALKRGDFTSLDQTLGELLPDAPYQDSRQRGITVWQLLSMAGGFEWFEDHGPDYTNWIRSQDHVRYLLERPIVSEPGTAFAYNSAAVDLLGVVLQRATGQTLEEFADEVLFGPLGITRRRWEVLPEGHDNGGAGLDLRPRDLARLGQLYLQEGRSGDQNVLSRSWTVEATRPHWGWRSRFGPLHALSYGYLWWTDSRPEGDVFLAWGWGGQFILVQRATGLVVVATTEWRGMADEDESDATTEAVLNVIVDHVLGAVQ